MRPPDRVAVCPECRVRARQKVEALRARLKRDYGVILADQWLALRRDLDDLLARMEDPGGFSTLREWASVGMDDDGVLQTEYEASCLVSACGWTYSLKRSDTPV